MRLPGTERLASTNPRSQFNDEYKLRDIQYMRAYRLSGNLGRITTTNNPNHFSLSLESVVLQWRMNGETCS